MIEMHPYLMPLEHFDLVLVSPWVFFSFVELVGLFIIIFWRIVKSFWWLHISDM